jgi:flagellar P-ring protein precursor FlgI
MSDRSFARSDVGGRPGCNDSGTPAPLAATVASLHRRSPVALAGTIAAILLALAAPALAQTRVGDLTHHAGEIPQRLSGYGLVVGLDGTGDRSFGGYRSGTATVRSVVNLLRRFDIEVPADHLRLRNVAAVLVTAEVSPYLRAGGRFEVQVAALGDAASLRGGVLWITPLVLDPGQPPIATAQGPILVPNEGAVIGMARRGNSARIAEGGVLEIDPPPAVSQPRLLLTEPQLATATRIATAVNAVFGAGTARVTDPGAIELAPDTASVRDLPGFLAMIDTVLVDAPPPARIVIDSRTGTVVAGAAVRVSAAVVSHRGITLEIGNSTPVPSPPNGLVRVDARSSVADVAAGLHAAGARAEDMAAIFEALERAGALSAPLVIR